MGKLSKKIKKNKINNGFDDFFFSLGNQNNEFDDISIGMGDPDSKAGFFCSGLEKPENEKETPATFNINLNKKTYNEIYDSIVMDPEEFGKKYNYEYEESRDIFEEDKNNTYPRIKIRTYLYHDLNDNDEEEAYVCTTMEINDGTCTTDVYIEKENINTETKSFKPIEQWCDNPYDEGLLNCTININKI